MPDHLADTAAVVVHHHYFPGVLQTVGALLHAGLARDSIVIVDNSEDADIANQLRSELPDGVRLECVANHGYAHAVNTGASVAAARNPRVVLVMTHEVEPEEGAIARLVATIIEHDEVGAAGPTLRLPARGSRPGEVWSVGGSMSKVLGWPGHERRIDLTRTVPRAWLDGSFCAYRAEALAEGLREDFFLYVEELEFHRRLRDRGWHIVWDPAACAVQDTLGAPPYLQARNLQLFYDSWGSKTQRALSVPGLVARQAVIRLIRRQRPIAATVAGLRGWLDGRSRRGLAPVGPVNLPVFALKRY